ncbi:FGGY-family carbohydrate kinase [Nocardia sp. NBC_01499]|uniref:xylulokinase n=1 Tax=Nocardia sp. NBC_01499 TaxID=2903597 RepID=UPI00386A0699
MGNELVLGIDVGTTAVKVAVFTVGGPLVRACATEHVMTRPGPGLAEQDPGHWWQGCVRGIEAVLKDVAPESVRAVGVVSQVNTHIFVDANLRPLMPAITWQDQRCAAVARELDGRFTAEEKAQIWGGPFTFDASRLVSRALWVARHDREVWRRTRWVLSPKDYINARLTGEIATDGLSSVGLVDGDGTGYLADAVRLVDGLAERLPPLAGAAEPVGAVVAPELVGLLGSATVVVGTMDAFGDIYGSGLITPGRAMIACGTSLVVAGTSEHACASHGVVTFPPIDGLYVHAGPTQAGGEALRWWSRTCARTVQQVVTEAAAAAPGGSGVVFTPYLMGERAPLWDATVRGSFLGLSATTSRAELSRAVLEGVAMSGRQVLAAVETACGTPLASVTFSGGGANSDLWSQIFADVLRRPVQRLETRDYSAVLGAALLASVGAAIYPDIATATDRAVTIDRVFTPDNERADLLDPLFEVYLDSYQALRNVHAKLADWRAHHND